MNSSNLKYYNIDVLISKVKVNIPFRNNIIPRQKKVRILKMLLKKQIYSVYRRVIPVLLSNSGGLAESSSKSIQIVSPS